MPADASGSAAPMDFESALARLAAVVAELESGDAPLADALRRYEEGVALLRRCRAFLDAAEQRVRVVAELD